MTGIASSLAYPGSRALAEWWRQISAYRPIRIWFGHLFLHRVEALVGLKRPYRPDALSLLVLEALAIESPTTVECVESRLHVGIPLTGRLLRRLAANGLIAPASPGWALAERGRALLSGGTLLQPVNERRCFYFVDNDSEQSPHFVSLATGIASPYSLPTARPFDIGVLTKCIEQRADWKVRHGFPLDVECLIPSQGQTPDLAEEADDKLTPGPEVEAGDTTIPRWQRVSIVHPESTTLLIAKAGDGGGFRAFTVQQKGWLLNCKEPIHLAEGLADILPALREELAPHKWSQAWIGWAGSAGLSPAHVDASQVRREGHRLVVSVPSGILNRLRATRNEVLKGEVWLLAGDDRVREAAQLQVVASS
jgi:hypothetical protein